MSTAHREFRVDYLGEIHTDPARADGVLATVDDRTGFLRLDARLTRTGVFEYSDREGNRWGELRTEAEVFDTVTMRSFEMAVVTDDHPRRFVGVDNVKDVQVGTVGNDVRRDGDFMVASILITDAVTIQKIKDGKQELSCGYWATVIADAGEADGRTYRGKHTKIRGNHVAVVDRGRAGPDCRLLVDGGDIFAPIQPGQATPSTDPGSDAHPHSPESPAPHKDGQTPRKDHPMKLEFRDGAPVLVIDGAEHPVTAEILAELTPKQDTQPDPEVETLRGTVAALEAKLDTLPGQINARVRLVRDAEAILHKDVSDLDERSVKAEVIKHVTGIEIADSDSDGYVSGLFAGALKSNADARVDELAQLGGGEIRNDRLADLDAKFANLQQGKA